jgi:hypothetical protein
MQQLSPNENNRRSIMKTLRRFGDWALVTGASSGIGQAYATALAGQGFNLLLVARGAAALDQVANDLSRQKAIETRTLALDLSEPAALPALFRAAEDVDAGVIVSNAGAGGLGAFLDRDIAEHRALFHLNATAHLEIAHHFARRFQARGKRGAILLATSTGGLHGMPYGAAYAAAKGAVIVLAESLNVEFAGSGVHITAVSPGMTDTPATRNDEAIDFSKLPFKAMAPTAVAAEGLAALARNDAHHIVGGLNRFVANVVEQRITGRARAVRLMGKVVRKALKPRRSITGEQRPVAAV